MKKTAFFILMLAVVNISFSQTDLITALKAIGPNVEYTEYWNIVPGEGGKNEISEKRYTVTLVPALNRFNKIVGFDAVDTKKPEEKRIRYDYSHGRFDHYTHPSFYDQHTSRRAFFIINGVIFELEKFKDINSFEIDKLWIPKIPKDKSSDPVFQGGKMSDLKSADLVKMVKDYFEAMKKIQSEHPLNTTDQAEADVMKFVEDSTTISIRQGNAAYWNSEEGKRKLSEMRNKQSQPDKKTVKNVGRGMMYVMSDNGACTSINGGSTSQFPCRANLFYCHADGGGHHVVKGRLISGANQNCGETISASDGK